MSGGDKCSGLKGVRIQAKVTGAKCDEAAAIQSGLYRWPGIE